MRKSKILVLISIILTVSVLICSSIAAADIPAATGYDQALINICDFGAIPNDGKDDTSAFMLTINSSIKDSIYIPPGTYNITESIKLYDSMVVGAGTDKTVIIADLEKVRDPIVWMGGSAQLRDITIKFADHCINGTEISGERCGIVTTAKGERRLCKGGAVTNVRIQNVGTGIYSPITESILGLRPPEYVSGNKENWNGDATCFSTGFEGVTVLDFSFRGISMETFGRTGNVWRNIYLSSGKYEANTAIYFYNDESESSISEMTVADSKLKNGVRLIQSCGAQITNLTFVNTELVEDNTGFLYCDESSVVINNLTFKNSAPKNNKQAFIRLGDGTYRRVYYFPTNGFLRVYNMSILNPDLDIAPDSTQYMISRRNEYLSDYTVDIDNLRVVAPEALKAQYEAFNYDRDREIDLTLEGVAK
ncbi:MAG: hypothetical protein E7545_01750 [Ruminococcaceae bacterium]|nr:hypothetical protein [Oscillospiraceae bacterium]